MADKKLKTHKLFKPLTINGEAVEEVTIHPLKAKDMIAAEEELMALNKGEKDLYQIGTLKRQVCMIARMIRLPQPDVGELAAEDYRELSNFL